MILSTLGKRLIVQYSLNDYFCSGTNLFANYQRMNGIQDEEFYIVSYIMFFCLNALVHEVYLDIRRHSCWMYLKFRTKHLVFQTAITHKDK